MRPLCLGRSLRLPLILLLGIIAPSHTADAPLLYKNTCPDVSVRQGIVLEQTGLAPHAADIWGTAAVAQGLPVETRLDIYTCNGNVNHPLTLLIFAVDGPLTAATADSSTQQQKQQAAGTQALTTFARHLAQRGLVVVVAEKRNLAFHENLSSFLSLDFLRVIRYMQSGAWQPNDDEEKLVDVLFHNVVIAGHGLGGKMA